MGARVLTTRHMKMKFMALLLTSQVTPLYLVLQ